MKRSALAGCLTAALVVPAIVPAEQTTLRHKYKTLYSAVKKKHGKRAPGRNIVLWGVKKGNKVRPATNHQIAKSIRTLRPMLGRYTRYLRPGRPPIPPGGIQTMNAGSILNKIAQCESGGNPRAVDPSGTYRGKYQFDYGTWASVGGSGDPAQASEVEQDKRAAMLYQRRGAQPWPVCGR